MTTTGPGTARPDPAGTTTRDHDHPDGAAGRGPDALGAAAWDLPAEARAASRARDLTARTLHRWHLADPAAAGDIVLMVDELVTNAVVHGTGPVRLALRLDGTLLTAEVSDAHPAEPAVPGGPPRVLDWAEAGRGLLLVAALATEFGARPRPPGKTVWFTRDLAPAPTGPGAAESGAAEPGSDAATARGGEPGAGGRPAAGVAASGVAVPAPRRPEPGHAPAR
ncbi:ATP-binding protein [Actinomadura bangladeshensis]|uniref:ATP-binding protein n=2 Tax=Actinomadura bangladeshensis TaxID=453573 RepID=UPI0031D3D297